MFCETKIYGHLTDAKTKKLRKRLDVALQLLRGPQRGDESDDWALYELLAIVNALGDANISTPSQLGILYDALDYLADEQKTTSKEWNLYELGEERGLIPRHRALVTLGRYAMAQRQAAKAATAEVRA